MNYDIVTSCDMSVIELDAAPSVLTVEGIARSLASMAQLMQGMSDMLRTTNDRMGALEGQVRRLTKVTRAQVGALNAARRARAAELCTRYRMPGFEGRVANCILREVKLESGITAIGDLPQCEYDIALQRVALWENYKCLKEIKAKGVPKHDE